MEQTSKFLDEQKEVKVFRQAFFVANAEGRRSASCTKCSSVADRLDTGVIRSKGPMSFFLSDRYLLSDAGLVIAMMALRLTYAVFLE